MKGATKHKHCPQMQKTPGHSQRFRAYEKILLSYTTKTPVIIQRGSVDYCASRHCEMSVQSRQDICRKYIHTIGCFRASSISLTAASVRRYHLPSTLTLLKVRHTVMRLFISVAMCPPSGNTYPKER